MACRGSGVRVPVAPPTRDETAEPSPLAGAAGGEPSPRTHVTKIRTEPARTEPASEPHTHDRALRPGLDRAALAGALGGARPARHGSRGRHAAQVLPADDVPVSVGRPPHRPLVHRHPERRAGALPPDARLQRVLPDRVRRLRPARRERGDQERWPSVHVDDAEHREHAPAVPHDGRDVRLEERGRHRGSVLLPVEPVAVPALPGGRPGLPGACPPSTGARTTGRWRASRSRAPTGTAGAAAPWSRSATWSSGSCGRPRTRTSCSTSPASTGRSRSRSSRRTGSAGPRAPRSTSRSRPTTTSRAATACACSPPARTRCSGRPSWSSRRSTRWSRS